MAIVWVCVLSWERWWFIYPPVPSFVSVTSNGKSVRKTLWKAEHLPVLPALPNVCSQSSTRWISEQTNNPIGGNGCATEEGTKKPNQTGDSGLSAAAGCFDGMWCWWWRQDWGCCIRITKSLWYRFRRVVCWSDGEGKHYNACTYLQRALKTRTRNLLSLFKKNINVYVCL